MKHASRSSKFNFFDEIALIPFTKCSKKEFNMRSEAMTSTAFPMRLYAMLDAESETISWTSSGLAFKVKDVARFRQETLPKYYKHTKITSFQRQLNLYGFARLHKGEDAGAYAHHSFVRGRKELVRNIRRVSTKTADAAKRSKKMQMSGQNQHRSSGAVRMSSRNNHHVTAAPVAAAAMDTKKSALNNNVGVSALSKVLGGGAGSVSGAAGEKKKNLFSQLEQCRELQFKSTHHIAANPWRQMLGELPLQDSPSQQQQQMRPYQLPPQAQPEDFLLSCPIIEMNDGVDVEQRRTMANSEITHFEGLSGSGHCQDPMVSTFDFDQLFFDEDVTAAANTPCQNCEAAIAAASMDISALFDEDILELLAA